MKSCLLYQDPVITVCKNSRLLDQHYCQAINDPNPFDTVVIGSLPGTVLDLPGSDTLSNRILMSVV
jgi:hypothetical protein